MLVKLTSTQYESKFNETGKTQSVEHQEKVVAGQELALTFEENKETAQLTLASR